MRYTNKFDAPENIILAAIERNKMYSRGNSDISVTQLINSPRVDILRKKHFDNLEKDISEEFFALFGSAVHHILELGRKPNQILEERLFLDIDGTIISGALDVQEFVGDDLVDIIDYKVTMSYSVMDDNFKHEWEEQQNIYKYLIEMTKPYKVRRLRICAIIRDWTGAVAARDKSYPQSPIHMVDLPVWDHERAAAFVKERVAFHVVSRFHHDMAGDLPDCTKADMWETDHKWAAMKTGGKRATKVFDNHKEAMEFVDEKGAGMYIDYRPGERKRCSNDYCGVSRWCSQFKEYSREFEIVAQETIPFGDDSST